MIESAVVIKIKSLNPGNYDIDAKRKTLDCEIKHLSKRGNYLWTSKIQERVKIQKVHHCQLCLVHIVYHTPSLTFLVG